MTCARTQSGIGTERKIARVSRTQTVIVGPVPPRRSVVHRNPTLGTEPDSLLRIDRDSINPLVYQLLYVIGELQRLQIDLRYARPRPSADPEILSLLRK